MAQSLSENQTQTHTNMDLARNQVFGKYSEGN
jgi:hypothetical protein